MTDTIFTYHGETSKLYISMESMNRVGYFNLTVAEHGGYFKTTQYDALESVTGRISELISEHTDKTVKELIKMLEELAEYFGDGVEVWADEGLPYLMVWEDED